MCNGMLKASAAWLTDLIVTDAYTCSGIECRRLALLEASANISSLQSPT